LQQTVSLNSIGHRAAHNRWEFVECTAQEFTARFALLHTAPLLEKERHVTRSALALNGDYPIAFQWARAMAAFAADNNPTYPAKINGP
jgi:hypothetical protein